MALFTYEGEPHVDGHKTVRGVVFDKGKAVDVDDGDVLLVAKLRALKCFVEGAEKSVPKTEAPKKKEEPKAHARSDAKAEPKADDKVKTFY